MSVKARRFNLVMRRHWGSSKELERRAAFYVPHLRAFIFTCPRFLLLSLPFFFFFFFFFSFPFLSTRREFFHPSIREEERTSLHRYCRFADSDFSFVSKRSLYARDGISRKKDQLSFHPLDKGRTCISESTRKIKSWILRGCHRVQTKIASRYHKFTDINSRGRIMELGNSSTNFVSIP